MGNRSAFLGFGFTFNGFVHIGCGLVKVHVRLGVVLGGPFDVLDRILLLMLGLMHVHIGLKSSNLSLSVSWGFFFVCHNDHLSCE